MGAQNRRNSKLRKKMKKIGPQQRPKTLAELEKKYHDLYASGNYGPTQEPKTSGGFSIEQHVQFAGELARDYKPSAYLKTAPIGGPYKGQ